jgi:hypothetical protein
MNIHVFSMQYTANFVIYDESSPILSFWILIQNWIIVIKNSTHDLQSY